MRAEGTAPGNLARLLRPRSVAIFGGRAAAEAVAQLRASGYDGSIWPVHPNRAEIAGVPAYCSVAALPASPDAAFLAVNRHATIEIVAALAGRGAGGAIAYASGFAESGESGRILQAKLVAAAGAMPVLGPNCYGFINYLDGVLLWPDQHGGRRVDRGVAIVTQSGNIGLNLTMQRRGVPIAYLVTLGNQAVVDVAATIEALLEDGRVTAIGLHIEGIAAPGDLAHAAAVARKRGVPIVALKTGHSPTGAALASSHTAALAGSGAVIDAFLRRIGIVPVASIPVLLETLKLLHLGGPLGGRDIASLSCSGGEAALIADAVAGRTLRFRPFTPAQQAEIAATLPELVAVSNPLDYHTFSWANERALTDTFTAVMRAGYGMTLLILDFPRPDRCSDRDWMIAARALIAASRRTGARAAVVATLPEAMPEERGALLAASGVTPLLGMDEALAALAAAAEAGDPVSFEETISAVVRPAPSGRGRMLSEWEGKRLLASYGVAVPGGRLVRSPAEAADAAAAIGFPAVLKTANADIAHKTEIGGIRLGLGDAASVVVAARELQRLGEVMLVERMIGNAVAELIVGIGRDPVIGLYLLVGSGGVLSELVGDSRILMLPATREEIGAAIGALKVGRLLDGFRGRPKGDLSAAVDAAMIVQSFALEKADRLLELDINPLLVLVEGDGVVAADVLIRFTREDDGG